MSEAGTTTIGRTVAESTEQWPPRRTPAASSPNVVVVLLDDIGFAQLGCYGSTIETPVIDRLAEQGLRYTNFHTTALCSPTRASLLTGRNPHSVGFGHIVERAAGFPGYDARLPDTAATLPAVLRQAGYSTWAVGKWHLVPSYEAGPGGPFDRWPLGRGFERFYGFLGGSTDQYAPELYRDNSPAGPSTSAADGYHLTTDLVDESISLVRELRGVAPHKPFFLYLAPGAGHAPHQVPQEWVERYRGRFDLGWDAARQETLERQCATGIVPEHTHLAQSNPGVPEWGSLTDQERKLYARMMEVYAGFLSHTDAQLGRLVDFLEQIGELDDTVLMVLSDNGASAEGGPEGSLDEALYFNDLPQRAEDAIQYIDELGGPRFYNHYPWGWAQAGNTPFRWYKQFTHAGGLRTPLVVHYPRDVTRRGELRHQYHHVVDLAPTVLDIVGMDWPAEVAGVQQLPVHGVSMTATLTDPDAEGHPSQHYEVWGNRGMWHQGWMAISRLQPDAPGGWPPQAPPSSLDDVPWELYDHATDPAECDDVANTYPEKLRELVERWWAAAGQHQVLPVDTRARGERWSSQPLPIGADPKRWVFRGPCGPYERGVAPPIAGRSFQMTADITIPAGGAQGVLYALGGGHGGYSWYLLDGHIVFEVNLMTVRRESLISPVPLSEGEHQLRLQVLVDDTLSAHVAFGVDGMKLDEGHLDKVLKIAPIGSGRTQVGFDSTPTVSDTYQAPFEFTGIIHQLTVTTLDAERASETEQHEAHRRAQ